MASLPPLTAPYSPRRPNGRRALPVCRHCLISTPCCARRRPWHAADARAAHASREGSLTRSTLPNDGRRARPKELLAAGQGRV